MATLADSISNDRREADALVGTPRAHPVDRWIFVAMAVWYIIVVLVGFIPDSMMKIGMVEAGIRPPFPPILHAHALVMGSFLLVLLAQTWLMATGRPANHMRLGNQGLQARDTYNHQWHNRVFRGSSGGRLSGQTYIIFIAR